MNVLSTAQHDVDFPLHALAYRVRAAIGLHDRLQGHAWLIGDGPQVTKGDADALPGCDLAGLTAAAARAVCGQCGRTLGPYLREMS